MIAVRDLISKPYRDLQRELHADPKGYGGRGDKWAFIVLQIASQYRATSILDYGCGEGALAKVLKAYPLGAIRVDEYDPAIRGKETRRSFADLVVCTDVLEHVEPDHLTAVLQDLKMLARKAVFVVIATKPSGEVLADGRNAHLIVQPGAWWKARLRAAGFTLHNPPTIVREKPDEWVGVLTPCA